MKRKVIAEAAWIAWAIAVCSIVAPDAVRAQTEAPTAGADTGLQPGDVIRVRIWREPDLSGEFSVDASGLAVLPRLGPVEVTGRTAESLVEELTDAYARYLRNPSIEVTALRRVSVQGEVRNPGLYPVDATVSIADVLAIAGGFTPDADRDKVRLVREGRIVPVELSPQMIVERSVVRSGDQIFVTERPWLARNSGVVIGAGISAVALIFTTAFLR